MDAFAIINHRTGTAAQWTTANPVLEVGELGLESDTRKIKFGDGETDWQHLDYIGEGSHLADQERLELEIFNNQTAATSGNDRVPFAGKIYIADPTVVGPTGAYIDGAATGDLWFW